MRKLFPALAALAFALPAGAQETRVGEPGFESPPADLSQIGWLIGQWSGEGIGGAPATESWLPPTGPTMVGTFIQQTDEGGIRFTEHMYLMEEEGTLVLRLKHFNADLSSWEEKSDTTGFRLLAIEDCAAYFHALTLRCDGDDGLIAAVRMKSKDTQISELLFRFKRQPPAKSQATMCPDAMTTVAMNQCYSALFTKAEERRKRYAEAADHRNSSDTGMQEMIRASEQAFADYRDKECRAVHASFGSGSIRTLMMLSCLIEQTDRRTHTIWQNWLTYADSTPPALPEPLPTL